MSGRPRLRIALAMAAGVAVTVIAVLLGNWQHRRGDAKQARQDEWDAAARAPVAAIASKIDASAAAAQLPRRVVVDGQYVPAGTVYVDNRSLQGVAGFQVVTPLRLADGTAVLVNRGWIARDAVDPMRMPPVPTPDAPVRVEGLAVERVPRLLELAPATALPLPGIWPNLEFEDYERIAGARVARLVVQQTSDAVDGLRRAWPPPASGVEKHRGYALQWYGLAALGAGLTLFFGGRALRRGAP
jgi:cytochrome oxidase assembly protein ShyY1